MHILLACLKCFKGLSLVKPQTEINLESQVSHSVDPNEIEIELQFKNPQEELKLETERNNSNIEGTLNEYDFLSFGASSIKCISDCSSSFSDLFEIRNTHDFPSKDLNNPNRFLHQPIPKPEKTSCLKLHPPKNFAFLKLILNK
ncbi:hypothetical protein SteCoe_35620 [Stentor coeruleus]|uniref:Uncharacterized protein n=1 Tax=Stentor coeruleus TaxID=5963 RepID=A0A1R2ARU2_9CILI|nr:hypothetical protein SteCoe_35620 [Stentor coeruleus]